MTCCWRFRHPGIWLTVVIILTDCVCISGRQVLSITNATSNPPPALTDRVLFAGWDHGRNSCLTIQSMELNGSHRIRISHSGRFEVDPAWSADRKQIAFAASDMSSADRLVGHRLKLFAMNSDGTNERQLTHPPEFTLEHSPSWSPDGKYIAFTTDSFTRKNTSTGMVAAYTGTHIDIIDTVSEAIHRLCEGAYPSWSPDGQSILFTGDRGFCVISPSGGPIKVILPFSNLPLYSVETRTRSYPETADYYKSMSSVRAVWSRDGKQIAYAFPGSIGKFPNMGCHFRSSIWVMKADGTHRICLTPHFEPAPLDDNVVDIVDYGPVWSQDGSAIVFSRLRNFNGEHDIPQTATLNQISAAGGNATRITPPGLLALTPSSADRFLYYARGL